MNIGIFGGSFDPVHYGHLLLAQQALQSAKLDSIRFIPAAVPPHKKDHQLSRDAIRVEMLKFATAGNPDFFVDTCEIDRGGVSYTVDTLRAIHRKFPEQRLFLLMGADSLLEFHTWKDPELICELATPVVICRPPVSRIDYGLFAKFVSAEGLAEIKRHSFQSYQIELSSSGIRESISSKQSIRYQTPRAVEQYIHQKGLYLPPPGETQTQK